MSPRHARAIRYGITKCLADLAANQLEPPANDLAALAYYRTWAKQTAAKSILNLKDKL